MEEEDFLAAIAYIGEKNVLGFIFDNSAREIFYENARFSLEEYYVPEIKSLKIPETDIAQTPYTVFKHIANIQGIMSIEEENWGKINERWISQ